MARNSFGLGFSFSAEDDGVFDAQSRLLDNFSELDKALDGYNDEVDRGTSLSASFVKQGLGKVKDTLSSISDGLKNVTSSAGKMGQVLGQMKLQNFVQSMGMLRDASDSVQQAMIGHMNLTTGYEAEMASLGKGARAMGAQLGYTGKDLKKFTGQAAGLAYAFGTSEEAAGKAIRAWDEAGAQLKSLGFQSEKDLLRFTEAFGVEADMLRDNTLRMSHELGLSEPQIRAVTDALVTMGQQTGDVPAAMQQLPDIVNQLSRRKALGDTPEELADFARQIPVLATGYFQLSESSELAMQSSMQLAEVLTSSRVDFSKMFSGLGEELPGFVKEFSIAGGDVRKAMELAQGGPLGLAEALKDVDWSALDQNQLDFFRNRITEAFGGNEEAANQFFGLLKAGGKDGGKDIFAMMKAVQESTVDLGKLGREAHTTGRTLAEMFERAKDGFISSFRKIGRKAARDFVTDTSIQFKKFNNQLTELVAEGGPLGAVVQKFSEMHQIGGLALVPRTLRPMAAIFGEMTQEAAPMIGILGSLGLRFSHLTNPLALTAAGLVAVGLAFKTAHDDATAHVDSLVRSSKAMKQENNQIKSLRKALAGAAEGSSEYLKIQEKLDKAVTARNAAVTIKSERKAIEGLTKARKKAAGDASKLVEIDVQIAQHRKAIEQQQDGVRELATHRTIQHFKEMAKALWEGFKTVISKVPELASQLWSAVSSAASDIADQLLREVELLFQAVWLFDATVGWENFFDDFFASASEGFGSKKGSFLDTLTNIGDEIVAIFDPRKGAKSTVGKIAERLGQTARIVGGAFFRSLGKFISSGGAQDAILRIGQGILAASQQVTVFLQQIPWDQIWTVPIELMGTALEALTDPKVGEFIGQIAKGILERSLVVGEALVSLLDTSLTQLAQTDVSGFATSLLTNLQNAAFTALEGTLPFLQGFVDRLPSLFSNIGEVVVDTLAGLPAATGDLMATFGERLREFLPKLIPMILDGIVSFYKFIFIDLPVQIISKLPEFIVGVFEMMWAGISWVGDALIGIFDGAITWVEDKWPGLGHALRVPFDWIVGLWDDLKSGISGFFDSASDLASEWSDAVIGTFERIPEAAGEAWDAFVGTLSNIPAVLGEAWDWLSDLPGKIGDAFVSAGEALVAAGASLLETVRVNVVDPVVGFISTAFHAVADPIVEAITAAFDAVVGVVKGMIRGLPDMAIDLLPEGIAEWAGANGGGGGENVITERFNDMKYESKKAESKKREEAELMAKLAKQNAQNEAKNMRLSEGMSSQGSDASRAAFAKGLSDYPSGLVETDIGKATQAFDEMAVEAVGANADIEQSAIDTYGNSIHDYVNVDLGKVLTYLPIWTSTFQNALIITAQVGVLAFSGAAELIQEKWVGLLSGIALSTSDVAEAISADMRGVLSDAETVSRTMANLERAKVEIKKGDMPDVLVRPGETLDTATLRAIHSPDWYYKHYAQRFESLISAVKSLRSQGARVSPSGGRAAGSRSKQAADRVPQHFPQLAGGR